MLNPDLVIELLTQMVRNPTGERPGNRPRPPGELACGLPRSRYVRVRPVQYAPFNRLGRDFVVGDVHGCFRTLDRALAAFEFDASRDRLFGVGDLVERGPHSHEALDWIDHRFTGVTLGNHEDAVLGCTPSAGSDSRLPVGNDTVIQALFDHAGLPLEGTSDQS